MNKEKSRSQYFVQIREPVELRRRILEASKSTIHGLQGYHAFLEKRSRKLQMIAQLKREVQEILVLHAKLAAALPSFDLPPERPVKVTAPVSKKSKRAVKSAQKPVKKAVEKPREKTELEKLDDLLAKVEQKLQRVDS